MVDQAVDLARDSWIDHGALARRHGRVGHDEAVAVVAHPGRAATPRGDVRVRVSSSEQPGGQERGPTSSAPSGVRRCSAIAPLAFLVAVPRTRSPHVGAAVEAPRGENTGETRGPHHTERPRGCNPICNPTPPGTACHSSTFVAGATFRIACGRWRRGTAGSRCHDAYAIEGLVPVRAWGFESLDTRCSATMRRHGRCGESAPRLTSV